MRSKLGWLIILIIVSEGRSLAQGDEKLLSIGGGYSRHGTDDVGGIYFSANYFSKLRSKFGYSISLSSTLHDGGTSVLYFDEINAVWKKGKLPFVTAGIQLSGGLTYRLANLKKSNIILGLSPVLRYQSTSNPDYSLANFYPTNYFSDNRFERSFSFGGTAFLIYSVAIKDNFFVSITASMQYDTQEDALSMIGFSVGRRINIGEPETD